MLRIMTARKMANRVGKQPFIYILFDVLEENVAIFEQAQKDQLKAGKGKDGGYLPKYQDDPFFKDNISAQKYEDWKATKSPDKSKPRDVMDFWIDGTFNRSVDVDVKDNRMIVDGNNLFDKVSTKTGGNAYGLSRETVLRIMEEKVMPEALKRWKKQLFNT